MKNIFKNKWVLFTLILVLGILIGWLISSGGSSQNDQKSSTEQSAVEPEIWTCSMHPQIQLDAPGKCPLCGMDLIPLENSMGNEESLPDEVPMSDAAMNLADVQTYIVKKSKPEKEIRLLGKVKADERLMYSQAIHFPGRVENLFINYTGEKVRKGQRLASVYSAELVTAQKELFEVLKDKSTNPALVNATRNKLKQWKFTDEQIEEIEMSGKVQSEIDILSDFDGYVMMLMVSEGDHFKEGQILFQITDLTHIWVLFEAYENDLQWIAMGDELQINLKSIPGKTYKGKVTFIDPFINPKTRVAYVRVELPNANGQLKPDMFANGIISSELPADEEVILVPKSAVLWTGKRAVVYVKLPNREHNSFIYRQVILGEDVGDFYIIRKGLEEGEEIATNGVFKIDASAQLAGKMSMMNSESGKDALNDPEKAEDKGGVIADKSHLNVQLSTSTDKSGNLSAFRKELGSITDSYLEIKDALVASDLTLTRKQAEDFQMAVDEVNADLLEVDLRKEWISGKQEISSGLQSMIESEELEAQRAGFSKLSNALIAVLQFYGLRPNNSSELYLQYCPMALGNKGAYWISSTKEIRNPYFGQAMLKCGETKELIKMN